MVGIFFRDGYFIFLDHWLTLRMCGFRKISENLFHEALD